jgi:hypothetical protein
MSKGFYRPIYKRPEPKFTRGGEYIIHDTLENYIGFYIESDDGQVYSEPEFTNGVSKLLDPTPTPLKINNDTATYFKRTSLNFAKQTYPESYIPIITAQDIAEGKLQRFVAQKRNEPEIIIEIDLKQYKPTPNGTRIFSPGIDTNVWYMDTIQWTIKGAYKDIIAANRKVLHAKEKDVPGISKYFTDLAEFIQVPITGEDRIYTDGDSIPSVLPTSYKLYTAPDVPLGQQCGNCIFKSYRGCQKWNAPVRNNYWCQAWKHGVR